MTDADERIARLERWLSEMDMATGLVTAHLRERLDAQLGLIRDLHKQHLALEETIMRYLRSGFDVDTLGSDDDDTKPETIH